MPDLHFLLERIPSPLGEILIVTDEHARLRGLDWHDYEDRLRLLLRRQYSTQTVHLNPSVTPSPASSAIHAYFSGNMSAINTLEVATGGTDFQREVWQALRDIPYGETISYGELSLRIGRPKAVRAVGMANGANPISIVVPCHRVIGSNRSLTGYGGGLDRKRWLLEHEQAYHPNKQLTARLPGF